MINKTASLGGWYKENGRRAVYAAGKQVPNIAKTRSSSLPVIAKVRREDLDKPVVSPYLVEEDKK